MTLEPFDDWVKTVDLYPIETTFCPGEIPDAMVVDNWLPDYDLEKPGKERLKL